MKKLLASLSALIILNSCTDDKPDDTTYTPSENPVVWVLNEGNFQNGNSAIGVFDPKTRKYSESVFESVNHRQLGDILQSATRIDNEVYLVINNSGKIEVVDEKSLESRATIKGLTSPRYILPISTSEALVSDLLSDSLAVIDLNSNTITAYYNIGYSSEQMTKVGAKVFITNTFTSHITVLNTQNGEVQTIGTTYNPTAIGQDKNGYVWVLCGGDGATSSKGALEVIDPTTLQIVKTLKLPTASYTNHLAFNSAADSVYYMTDNIYKVSIDATAAAAHPFVNGAGLALYGMAYDKATNKLWVGDAVDFNQKGKVYIYSSGGKRKHSFTAEINPSGFYFTEQ